MRGSIQNQTIQKRIQPLHKAKKGYKEGHTKGHTDSRNHGLFGPGHQQSTGYFQDMPRFHGAGLRILVFESSPLRTSTME